MSRRWIRQTQSGDSNCGQDLVARGKGDFGQWLGPALETHPCLSPREHYLLDSQYSFQKEIDVGAMIQPNNLKRVRPSA